jgi:hypothetical protein
MGRGHAGIQGVQNAYGARRDGACDARGEWFYGPFLGTMTAPTGSGCLEQRVAGAATKVTGLADWHPAHEAVRRGNKPRSWIADDGHQEPAEDYSVSARSGSVS